MTQDDRKCAQHAQNAADTWAKLDALKGAPTLEQMHGITQHVAGARIVELTAQRDELLAILRTLFRLYCREHPAPANFVVDQMPNLFSVSIEDAVRAWADAHAAIARAEGR